MVHLPFSIRRPLSSFLLLALLICLAGCSNYELGTSGRLDFATVYVAPVANKTMLPQVQAVMTAQVRDALEKDGRIALVNSPQAADVTLSVVLVNFHRDVAAAREADTGLASKFTETLGAACTLRDNRSGRNLFENRPITVQRDVFTDSGQPWSSLSGDQLQAEYNAVPLLASSLGDKVAHAVLDVW